MNSCTGLLGHLSSARSFPLMTALWLATAAILGGSLGSYLGSHRFGHRQIKRLLAVVLLLAGVKLLFA